MVGHKPDCDGNCQDCPTPEECNENICIHHTGMVSRVNILTDEVAEIRKDHSNKDKLNGKLTVLITVNLTLLLAVVSSLGYSYNSSKKTDSQFNQTKLNLEKTLNERDKRFTEQLNDLNKLVVSEINDIASDLDKRFDLIERELPLIKHEIRALEKNIESKHN